MTRVRQTARSVAAAALHLAAESGVRRAARPEITTTTARSSASVTGRHRSWLKTCEWSIPSLTEGSQNKAPPLGRGGWDEVSTPGRARLGSDAGRAAALGTGPRERGAHGLRGGRLQNAESPSAGVRSGAMEPPPLACRDERSDNENGTLVARSDARPAVGRGPHRTRQARRRACGVCGGEKGRGGGREWRSNVRSAAAGRRAGGVRVGAGSGEVGCVVSI